MSDVIFPDGSKLADIIANLNVFSSNPATSRGEGEIIYNSTDDEVYKNTGTTGSPVWEIVGGGGTMSELVDDTTPQLGGDLDCNNHDITNADTIKSKSGTDLTLESATGVFVFATSP